MPISHEYMHETQLPTGRCLSGVKVGRSDQLASPAGAAALIAAHQGGALLTYAKDSSADPIRVPCERP